MTNLQKKIILKALDAPGNLSEWENDFISGMADKPDSYELSQKQIEVFNRIWGKVSE